MSPSSNSPEMAPPALRKCPTGIEGLDHITGGGLPQGRPTLVCGSAGCGKTMLAMEFLVRGATEYGEPGVFMAFEETASELIQNVASLGFDLPGLIADGKLIVDYVRVERSEIEETGEYDLEGLFIRLGYAIDTLGARRVVLDTIESLFAGLTNTAILRAELRRLFRWLKDRGVTAVITGERGENTLTRQGLEEYVSDCVILLDHRVEGQISTRRLRVVKYRGSYHGTNEYPFLIDETGISVLPITSIGLEHPASTERISSGIPRLDTMLGGRGFYRGSSILVSGTAGTGKTSIGMHFIHAACRRGERCLYFSLEESRDQILRNMRSIGLDLAPWIEQDLLRFHNMRPTVFGLETHLAMMHRLIARYRPQVVVIDPISNLISIGNENEVRAMMLRLVDFLKQEQITALFTHLAHPAESLINQEATSIGISSIMDTWLLVQELETGGERNRGLYILKSRGMAHSNQIREFLLTDHGIELQDVYLGANGVLTGSARRAQESRNQREETARRQEIERRQLQAGRRRAALQAQISALQAEMEAEDYDLEAAAEQDRLAREHRMEAEQEMSRSRQADPPGE